MIFSPSFCVKFLSPVIIIIIIIIKGSVSKLALFSGRLNPLAPLCIRLNFPIVFSPRAFQVLTVSISVSPPFPL
jgi:hypothetical protein